MNPKKKNNFFCFHFWDIGWQFPLRPNGIEKWKKQTDLEKERESWRDGRERRNPRNWGKMESEVNYGGIKGLEEERRVDEEEE